jgi:hypothetical protein
MSTNIVLFAGRCRLPRFWCWWRERDLPGYIVVILRVSGPLPTSSIAAAVGSEFVGADPLNVLHMLIGLRLENRVRVKRRRGKHVWSAQPLVKKEAW